MKTGIELIAEERHRQIEKEGWTPEHDDQHNAGDLVHAAAAYTKKMIKGRIPNATVAVSVGAKNGVKNLFKL